MSGDFPGEGGRQDHSSVEVKDNVFSSSIPIVQKKMKENFAQAQEAAEYFTGITAEEIRK